MFEKASRLKLRINTHRGVLSVDDLWDLPLQELNSLAKDFNKQLKDTEEEDFLDDIPQKDDMVKLTFDIILYVLNTLKEERTNRANAKKIKDKRQRLLEAIEKKKDSALEDASIEDLETQLADLS